MDTCNQSERQCYIHSIINRTSTIINYTPTPLNVRSTISCISTSDTYFFHSSLRKKVSIFTDFGGMSQLIIRWSNLFPGVFDSVQFWALSRPAHSIKHIVSILIDGRPQNMTDCIVLMEFQIRKPGHNSRSTEFNCENIVFC